MKCRRVEKDLSAYLDGRLSDEAKRRVEGHLKTCPRCGERFEELSRIQSALSEFPRRDPSPFLWTRVKAGIESGEGKAPAPGSVWSRLKPSPVVSRWAVVVVASLVLVAGGVLLSGDRQDPRDYLGLEVAIAEDLELLEHFDLIQNLDFLESWEEEPG